jgi:hypothetical protein
MFLWVEIEKIHWKILELSISMKFGQQAPCYTLLPGKINFYQKRIRNLNSTQNRNLGWFHDSLNPKLYFWKSTFRFRLVVTPNYLLMTLIIVFVIQGVTMTCSGLSLYKYKWFVHMYYLPDNSISLKFKLFITILNKKSHLSVHLLLFCHADSL